MKKKIIVALFLLLYKFNISAQILNNESTKKAISTGLDKMYSYDFSESNEIFNQLKAKYPQHPLSYLLHAIQLELQFFPLKDHPLQQKVYLANLHLSKAWSEKLLEKNEDDIEANYFMLATLGYLAAYNADNQEYLKAVGVAKKAYSFLKKGLVWCNKEPEFLYTSGIYNYYRISYPETHPMIKPVIWMFADGDKKLGLKQLELASQKAIFVKTEATFYAGYVYMKYENNPSKALTFNNLIINKYPNNLLFQMQRAELLTSSGKYQEALPFSDLLTKQKSVMFQCAGLVFKGIITEKDKKDDKQAEIMYQKATQMPFDERFTKDYHALAYLGIARIAKRQGNREKMKANINKALKIAEYASTVKEAESLFK